MEENNLKDEALDAIADIDITCMSVQEMADRLDPILRTHNWSIRKLIVEQIIQRNLKNVTKRTPLDNTNV